MPCAKAARAVIRRAGIHRGRSSPSLVQPMTPHYIITDTDMATMAELIGLLLSIVAVTGFAIWRNKFWFRCFVLSVAVVIVAVTVLADLGS